MAPEYHSFLRAQIKRAAAAGGDPEVLRQCAMSFLAQERAARLPQEEQDAGKVRRLEPRIEPLKLVESLG